MIRQQMDAENSARFQGRNPTAAVAPHPSLEGFQNLGFSPGAAMAPFQRQMAKTNEIAGDTNLFAQLQAQAQQAVVSGSNGGGGFNLPTGGTDIGSRIIAGASGQLGVPYSWGGGGAKGKSRGIKQGSGTVGFDCSGLTQYAYARVGLKIPRVSYGQLSGHHYAVNSLRPGDLLGPRAGGHVAIYLGNGRIIESPHTGATVRTRKLSASEMKNWWGVRIFK